MAEHIDIKEFRALGYVQEINRRILHPMGLALEVTTEDDGSEWISGVWDYRDDPEGIEFGGDYMDELREKAVAFDRVWEDRRPAREAALGYMVQPLEVKP